MSPAAAWRRWIGGSPTESQQRIETEYQGTPEHHPTPAGSVTGRPESMSVEDSGALLQQVEGPNGLPRGGATPRAPQGFVASTPAAPDVVDYTTMIPELLTPVLSQANGRHEAVMDTATGQRRSYEPPPYGDIGRSVRPPDPTVDDRRGHLLLPEDRDFQARREPPRRSFEETAEKGIWTPHGEG